MSSSFVSGGQLLHNMLDSNMYEKPPKVINVGSMTLDPLLQERIPGHWSMKKHFKCLDPRGHPLFAAVGDSSGALNSRSVFHSMTGSRRVAHEQLFNQAVSVVKSDRNIKRHIMPVLHATMKERAIKDTTLGKKNSSAAYAHLHYRGSVPAVSQILQYIDEKVAEDTEGDSFLVVYEKVCKPKKDQNESLHPSTAGSKLPKLVSAFNDTIIKHFLKEHKISMSDRKLYAELFVKNGLDGLNKRAYFLDQGAASLYKDMSEGGATGVERNVRLAIKNNVRNNTASQANIRGRLERGADEKLQLNFNVLENKQRSQALHERF